MLSGPAAAAPFPPGTRRGTTERMPPIPRQKNEAPAKPSTNRAQTCGCGRSALTRSSSVVAAIPSWVRNISRRRPGAPARGTKHQPAALDGVGERAADEGQGQERQELDEAEQADRDGRPG